MEREKNLERDSNYDVFPETKLFDLMQKNAEESGEQDEGENRKETVGDGDHEVAERKCCCVLQ